MKCRTDQHFLHAKLDDRWQDVYGVINWISQQDDVNNELLYASCAKVYTSGPASKVSPAQN